MQPKIFAGNGTNHSLGRVVESDCVALSGCRGRSKIICTGNDAANTLDTGEDAAPDETAILNFRHLLEKRQLTQGLFDEISVQ